MVFCPCPVTRPNQSPESRESGSWRCTGRRHGGGGGKELAGLQTFPVHPGGLIWDAELHTPPPKHQEGKTELVHSIDRSRGQDGAIA